MKEHQVLSRIRVLVWAIIIGLLLSGITAFPITAEVRWLDNWFQSKNMNGIFIDWIHFVSIGLEETNQTFPFLFYGTDWLAFAHIVIALVFAGCLKDPVRNKWVIDWGLIACILVIPLARIAGPIRQIPFFHRIIDCSFGVIAFIVLFYCRSLIRHFSYSYSKSFNP